MDLRNLDRVLAADPVYWTVNRAEDLGWQIDLYRETLKFLTRDFGLARRDYSPDFDDALRTHRVLEYVGARTGVEVEVTDRDRTFDVQLWTRHFPFRRWRTDIGWTVLALTGEIHLVTNAEALKVGRREASRLNIVRTAAFIRTRLPDFLRGKGRPLLRASVRARREYWASAEGKAHKRGDTWRGELEAAYDRQGAG